MSTQEVHSGLLYVGPPDTIIFAGVIQVAYSGLMGWSVMDSYLNSILPLQIHGVSLLSKVKLNEIIIHKSRESRYNFKMLLYVSVGYSYGQSPKAQITPSFLSLKPPGQLRSLGEEP